MTPVRQLSAIARGTIAARVAMDRAMKLTMLKECWGLR